MNEMGSDKEILERYKTLSSVLYSRAKNLKRISYGILLVIFMLLIGGVGLFVVARQISNLGGSSTLRERLSDIEHQEGQLRNKFDELSKKRDAILSQIRSVFQKFTQPNPSNYAEASFNRAFDIFSKSAWVDILHEVSSNKKPNQPFFQPNIDVTVKVGDLPEIANQISSLTFSELSNDDRKFNDTYGVANGPLATLQEAERLVRKEILDKDVSSIIGGVPDENGYSESNLYRIIETNLTRFEIIALITFLVSILVPLYRYNLRLACFYDGKADALSLVDASTQSTSFVKMARALTPRLDFGKSPTTPTEQVIELARVLSDLATKRGRLD